MPENNFKHLISQSDKVFVRALLTLHWSIDELKVRSLNPEQCRLEPDQPKPIKLEADRLNLIERTYIHLNKNSPSCKIIKNAFKFNFVVKIATFM